MKNCPVCILLLPAIILVAWATMRPVQGDLQRPGAPSSSATDSARHAMQNPQETQRMNKKITYSKSGYKVEKLTDTRIAELATKLTPEERHILLDKGTEKPFCGTLLDNKKTGLYMCRLCGLPLFGSSAKYTSNTGWPSFFQPVDNDHIFELRDLSHGMARTEIQCMRCRSHLGHVFDDGPRPTGRRYCLNSGSLTFLEEHEQVPDESMPAPTATAYFAGGCFWGIEDRFQQVPGVIDAVSGYMGGRTDNPSYRDVCTDNTGHAETVRVTYDTSSVTYEKLLEWFFTFHDATQLNRQGPDVGSQYRSAIFADNDEQLAAANTYIESLRQSDAYRGRRIVTDVQPASTFYEAEAYHQDYHAKHGGSCAIPGSLSK